jgi:hypothetical protein
VTASARRPLCWRELPRICLVQHTILQYSAHVTHLFPSGRRWLILNAIEKTWFDVKSSGFKSATERYEAWVADHLNIVERHLQHKYEKMRGEGVFTFLRGTYYRWAELWESERKALARRGMLSPDAPTVFAVGDLHLENFGTWRDSEGRLVWGINDFDEAYPLDYTNDLVRLATSAFLARKHASLHWGFSHKTLCGELLAGYQETLNNGGQAFVLRHGIPWLWRIATHPTRSPEAFWEKLYSRKHKRISKELRKLAKEAETAIGRCLPFDDSFKERLLRPRQAGVGSLGRPRFIQFFEGKNGQFVREAKVVLPSAAVFVGLGKPIRKPYRKVLEGAVRVCDPFYRVRRGWLVRRLAFDTNKIELQSLSTVQAFRNYFHAMGSETANIHLGSKNAEKVARHLGAQNKRRPTWLYEASMRMVKVTQKDFLEFQGTNFGLPQAHPEQRQRLKPIRQPHG